MRNSLQKQRIATRNTAIYTQYRLLKAKHLRTDYIVEKLSERYFLSERVIQEVIREKAKEQSKDQSAVAA